MPNKIGPGSREAPRAVEKPEYDAVCADCKKACKLSFKPDPSRGPVYCRECYPKHRKPRM